MILPSKERRSCVAYTVVCVAVGLIIAGTILAIAFISTPVKTVETGNGLVRGSRHTSLRKKVEFFAFRGIPYAKPPVGDLRLKAPEPADAWAPNVLVALNGSNQCIQPDDGSQQWPQSEDCLYLNVFVPAGVDRNEKLAVMVYIHGGAYVNGNGDYIPGADFMMETGVILVTFNYRLGALGFLSLGLPEYSGNMGLKDQQLALKWVHQNIQGFGGDNTRITVFGQSAGGSSAHLHVLSAESRKYFRNAMAMSGSALHFWAMTTVENHLNIAVEMAARFGQPQTNVPDLVELLKTLPAKAFIEFTATEWLQAGAFKFPICPLIESENAIQPFIVQSPEDIYQTTTIDVDVMFGMTSQEFLMWSPHHMSPDIQANFDVKLPFYGKDISTDPERYRDLVSDVRRFYFEDAVIDDQLLDRYVTMLSDLNFVYHQQKAAELHAQRSSGAAFFYNFAVESTLNAFKRHKGYGNRTGASHCDELCYLFRCGFAEKYYDEVFGNPEDEQSKISLDIIDKMTMLFTNFAKNGQPIYEADNKSVVLPPIEANRRGYLEIANHGLEVLQDLRRNVFDFWANLEHQMSYSQSEEPANPVSDIDVTSANQMDITPPAISEEVA